MASVIINGNTSGSVTLNAPDVAGTTTLTLPATSGTILQSGTTVTEAQGGTGTTIGHNAFKNRIINGAMMIDQRNNGASVSATTTSWSVDRWQAYASQTSKYTIQQVSGNAPLSQGFSQSLKVTSSSAYSVTSTDIFFIRQIIEGYNIADLSFGDASAKTITLSFWVRSSLTGTFSGSLTNDSNRSYPFTYTISSADTWEQKTITLTGDTTGTWGSTNGAGLSVIFSLGAGSTRVGTANAWTGSNYYGATGATSVVGTNGATFYITGVQLEKGSTATSFDYRPYGTELQLCQRYYYRLRSDGSGQVFGTSWSRSTTNQYAITQFPVPMRITPTALEQSGTAGDYGVYEGGTATTCSSVPVYVASNLMSTMYAFTDFIVASGLTLGRAGYVRPLTTSGYLGWSAEL